MLYVNDILLATNDKGLLYEVKQFLLKNIDMKDMGEASYVIGICFLVLYVDDILLATNDKGLLYEVKQFLSKNNYMKVMG